mgnify:CR=1 FL=1
MNLPGGLLVTLQNAYIIPKFEIGALQIALIMPIFLAQITANQRPSSRSLLQASYTYSRSKGNFPGLFSTETGQLDPNLTSMYDLPDLMANRYGAMGLDPPHSLKLDGFYQFDLKKAGLVVLGASFRGQSGLAHNALAGHFAYGADESYMLARGSTNRSPFTWPTDLSATRVLRVWSTTWYTVPMPPRPRRVSTSKR